MRSERYDHRRTPGQTDWRHESLTQSIELQILDTRGNTRNIATLSLVVHELAKSVQATGKTVSEMAASIDTLGHLAKMHEHRLDRLEGESS